MAQIREVRLIDDLDGSEANQTITFGLGGKWYEIDLNVEHAEGLRNSLAPFVEKARKSSTPGGSARTRSFGGFSTPRHRSTVEQRAKADNDEIREWARGNGYSVADRGRIPETVLDAYRKRAGREQDKHQRAECEDLDNCPTHRTGTTEDAAEFVAGFMKDTAKHVDAVVEAPIPDPFQAPKQNGNVTSIPRADKGNTDVQPAGQPSDAEVMAWVRANANGRKISATRKKPTMTERAAYQAIHDTASA